MAKLYFRYGAMGSGKSLNLLSVAFNYQERNQNVLILTSAVDDRYGINKIKSRVGIEKEAKSISEETNIYDLFIKENTINKISCVLVDESQFLKKHHIIQLSDIVDLYDTPVICYGLRSSFTLEPFEGSMYLMTISDCIEELKTVCWCGKNANINARVVDNKITTTGEQIQIGGNESYVSLCRKHFKEGKIKK